MTLNISSVLVTLSTFITPDHKQSGLGDFNLVIKHYRSCNHDYYLICFNKVLHVNEEDPLLEEAILLDIEQGILPVNPTE